MPTFGLATAGILQLERQLNTLPLTSSEIQFAAHKECRDGVESSLYLSGLPSSSTRAELLGLLGALLIPQPVHVALDNKADVDYAQYLITSLCKGIHFDAEHCFHKKTNGDLWSVFVRLVCA
eukprot:12414858-Karenia_brevis.AAC.1